ncbi:nucleotidyltransferase domain-containing protein [Thermococcus waiotapuensis]|uniref:Nucleotidyltransferase domain-containing protein n=1 Tax=Thermococcus waiotapuensis TaxID=90909 RepID=A0AAE4NWQ3_9EURY|nr:nucleotidyltransferase domain-containing protein [Thermococcus waiotapuensis]MDV3104102.1 nucleotidyltransferase domain-containing protein [Thermococcus waiotapuensis]
MMRIFTLPKREKEEIIKELREALIKKGEILFAYLHDSFLEEGPFRDIDVGIYIRGTADRFYEMELEEELSRLVKFPVDVRILNDAPVAFRFRAIGGKLLFSRDERARCRFEEITMAEYHDYSYHLELYRREALGIPQEDPQS